MAHRDAIPGWYRPLDEEPEDRLVERAVSDRAAFDVLYARYAPRVFQYLLTYAESQDDAADIAQVVFLRVYEALPSYRPKGTFAAWLFRIARNAAIDAYRQRRRTLPWRHLPDEILIFPGPGPETAVIQRETLNQLRVLVAQLSPEKQEILALRFAAGLSSAEIAIALGKSNAAVRKQLTRTIQALKKEFGGYGF